MKSRSPAITPLLVFAASSLYAALAFADPDVVSLVLVDGDMRSDWPDHGVVAIRRPTSVGALSVNYVAGGTAVPDVDFTSTASGVVTIPDGDRETWIEFIPKNNNLGAGSKTITVTLAPGPNYAVTSKLPQQTATITLGNISPQPGAKAAIRFLNQATFGPYGDMKDVQELITRGYSQWLTDQFARKPSLLQGTTALYAKKLRADAKRMAWWQRVMNPAAKSDSLRQRVAYALSEIFVISDRLDEIGSQPVGMANYYDMLLKGAFGNYRDLLYNVGTHPCMGAYLSHLQNEKGDPDSGTFADENFAREIMQLFSIGLWELNQDGTRKLDDKQQPIPTYDNVTIGNMAKVMTGFSYAGPKAKGFYDAPDNYLVPMRMWDEYHDVTPKTLLRGVQLPARTASNPDKGTVGLLDYNAAIDCLFNHSNTPPFIAKQLIQKLVTSNPTPGYVSRVAAAFIDNGAGKRGDLQAVIRAVLLDREARDPTIGSDNISGKLKEPYVGTASLLRVTRSRSPNGVFGLLYLYDIHYQEPLSAPSVFNFFKPAFAPSGPVNDQGYAAPEFQILNSVTSLSVPNYYSSSIQYGFNYYGNGSRSSVKPVLTSELALVNDVPALLRRLDLLYTGGTLPKEQHQVIREAVEAIAPDSYDWKNERVRLAIYLIVTSPEFSVIK